ncbi:MAG: lamin tail domain-containing protein [Melioribacteraceae bacterium]|nr:lamin tail domain-containing protein [Melioribacteraceae bacterium]
MKILKWLSSILALALILVACNIDDTVDSEGEGNGSEYKLIINEYLASNDFCCYSEFDYPDWFEIYNYGTEAVDIGGMYVSDSKNDYTQHQIPTTDPLTTTIEPGGFLVIFCDKNINAGPLHVAFALGSGGDDITLVESDGRTIIDELTFGPQDTDYSMGLNPDGGTIWQQYSTPTPGKSNTGEVPSFPPSISDINVTPATIQPSDNVRISATVTDPDGDLASVTLTYGTDEVAMTANGDTYYSDLGTFDDGTVMSFFITAIDAEEQTTISDTLSFQVGYVPPVLFINEFLASNDNIDVDGTGTFPDWIEIYNPGSEAVDIGGYFVTDGLDELTAWQIPETASDTTTIPAGGFIVLIANKTPELGVLHVNLKLSGGGEQIGLTAPNGTTVIDSLTYLDQTTDVSEGRKPDGSDNWENFTTPTPGISNN